MHCMRELVAAVPYTSHRQDQLGVSGREFSPRDFQGRNPSDHAHGFRFDRLSQPIADGKASAGGLFTPSLRHVDWDANAEDGGERYR